ncbi:MAG: hypothetical protein RL368_674 [Pseudomonadota bacterium]
MTFSKPDSVRQRLLNAALSLMHEQGFHALTQARIAATAGVRQSHLTYYFPTRNDLLKAVVQESKNAMRATSVAVCIQEKNLSLESFKEILIQHLSTSKTPRLMLALTAACDEDLNLRQWILEFQIDSRARFVEILNAYQLFPSEDDLILFHCIVIGASSLSLQQGGATAQLSTIIRKAFERLVADCQPLSQNSSQVSNSSS